MTGETLATIITTVVVPIALRVLVHYFPWLADAVTPAPVPTRTTRAPQPPPQTAPQEDADGA